MRRGGVKAGADEALLHCRVEPDDIAYSASADALSIVDLTLHVTNPGDVPAAIGRLEVGFPAGAGNTALTNQVAVIGAAAGPVTPWAILAHGNGQWTAMPLPPAIGLEARQSLSFIFSNVIVNEMPGEVKIEIKENGQSGPFATLRKTHPSGGGQEKPVIELFTAEPAQVAQGGEVRLSWRTSYAAAAVLHPGALPVSNPAEGQVLLPVYETTNFQLTALGVAGEARAVAPVAVMPVRIVRLVAIPAGPVAPGTEVKLEYATEFATNVQFDQGIGAVAPSGSVTVWPKRTSIYTLSAWGLAAQTKALTITVTPP